MNIMKRYCIGFVASGELDRYVRNLSAEISKEFNVPDLSLRIAPHITFVYPFSVSRDGSAVDIKKIEDMLSEITNNQDGIKITLEGFDVFENSHETIFFDVYNNYDLIPLLSLVKNKFNFVDEDKKYDLESHKIHMSIARHLSLEQSLKIQEYLKRFSKYSVDFMFDNLTVFEFIDDKKVWEVYKSFLLR